MQRDLVGLAQRAPGTTIAQVQCDIHLLRYAISPVYTGGGGGDRYFLVLHDRSYSLPRALHPLLLLLGKPTAEEEEVAEQESPGYSLLS